MVPDLSRVPSETLPHILAQGSNSKRFDGGWSTHILKIAQLQHRISAVEAIFVESRHAKGFLYADTVILLNISEVVWWFMYLLGSCSTGPERERERENRTRKENYVCCLQLPSLDMIVSS